MSRMSRMKTTRRAIAGLLLAVLALAALMPLQVSAVFGWSLTASPTTLPIDEETDVRMRLTSTDGSGDIACLRLELPHKTQYRDGWIVATSVDGEWEIAHSDGNPTEINVSNKKGDAKLKENDWVEFTITIRPRQAGIALWTAKVSQDEKCEGLTFLPQIVIEFVLLDTEPTPTLAPTPSPTRRPKLTPTRTPTLPAATATPTQSPTRTPMPSPSSTTATVPPDRPRPTPTPLGVPSAAPNGPVDAPPPGAEPPAGGEPPSGDPGVEVAAPNPGRPDDPMPGGVVPRPAPDFRYQMPTSLYSVVAADEPAFRQSFDTTVALGAPVSWFIPALATGVPGLLIILVVAANVLIGASWLPTFGRLLGPAPDAPEDDAQIWWAAGRPIR